MDLSLHALNPNPLCFRTHAELYAIAADRMAEAINDAITERGAACAALSGGSTPGPIYERLARMPLDWPRVTFALADERFVPPEHEASNEGMLRRTLAPAFAQGARIEPMYETACDLDEAAHRADARYAKLTIDYLLLGMGADGHTASWFVGADGVEEAMRETTPRTVVAVRAPQAAGSAERLTLTFTGMQRARHIELVMTGHDKYDLIGAAYMRTDHAPVGTLFLLRGPRFKVLWAP